MFQTLNHKMFLKSQILHTEYQVKLKLILYTPGHNIWPKCRRCQHWTHVDVTTGNWAVSPGYLAIRVFCFIILPILLFCNINLHSMLISVLFVAPFYGFLQF